MILHRFKLYLFIGLLAFFQALCISAQEYTVNVKNISIEEGLLHRNVHTLFEDSNGLIWLGLTNGIQQYDGQDFKTWTKANKSGLLFAITAIGEDDAGWLWLYNNDYQKLVFIHTETKEILTAEEKFALDGHTQLPEIITNRKLLIPSSITKNNKDQLCFGSFNKDGKIYLYDSKNSLQSIDVKVDTSFSVFAVDIQDNYWLQTFRGNLVKVDSKGKTLKTFEPNANEFWYNFNLDQFGDLYFCINYLNIAASGFGKIDKKDNLIKDVIPQVQNSNLTFENDFIWVNRNKSTLEVLSKANLKRITLFDKDNNHISLFNSSHSPFKDSRGIYWIYGNSGLNKVEIEKNKFKKYLSFSSEKEKPFNNSARGFIVNHNSIIANFELGNTVKIDKAYPDKWLNISSKKWARPILKRSDNEYLIGYPFGVLSIDSTGQTIQEYETSAVSAFNGSWSLYEDEFGKLWIGAGDKLVYKNSDESVIQNFDKPESLQGIKNKRGSIQNMIPRDDGKLWFCSWIGLFLFDPVTEKVIARYGNDEVGENYLPAEKFYFIHQDKDGMYWIGTVDGLIKWKGPRNEQNEKMLDDGGDDFRLFTRGDGFSNDVIYAIFEDDFNRLWMSSDYGIMSFDKETHKVKAYLPKDGISHEEFNRTSQFKEADGTIYFGGMNGITSFHPKNFIEEEKYFAKLLITDFEIFDGKEERLIDNLKDIQNSKTINFDPNDRFFRIKFVLPTFQDKSQILYAWKVEGVDGNWNYQKENSVQVGILPYGQHTLRIKSQSGGGGWSPHELSIKVNVIKPFYLMTWFVLTMIGSLIGLIWLFFKERTQVLKREIKKATDQINKDKQTIAAQAEDLRKLDKLKSRFFANVSHELRTPLTLMLGPIKNLMKSNGHNQRDRKLLGFLEKNTLHLKNLVNEILDLSKLENNKMELQERPINFYSYLKNHMNQFYSFGSSKNVRFIANLPENSELVLNIDKNKFEKIINNFLSNALKFTPSNGQVVMSVEDKGSLIEINVKDTGSGISAEDLPYVFDRYYQSENTNTPLEDGTGIGLSLCRELAQLMGGKVWVESEFGKGSTFYFRFPKKVFASEQSNKSATPFSFLQDNIDDDIILTGQEGVVLSKKYMGLKILIAEDNVELREYYKIILSDFEVISFEHGQKALDYLNENKELPQLIISDLMMPVMGGMEFLERLKGNVKWRNIPVIMLTAKTNRLVKLNALRIGIDDYLTKPFDEEELRARINNLLEHYHTRVNVSAEEKNPNKNVLISDEDKKWLEAIETYIVENISNNLLSVNSIALEFNMSKSSLLRQLKKITGMSPGKYLQEHKLNYSRILLEQKEYKTVAEVAYKVGFKDAKSFARSFKQRFGTPPSVLLNL